MSKLALLSPTEASRQRDDWLSAVTVLSRQVRAWAEAQGWSVAEESRPVVEERLGGYDAPVLTIDMPKGQLILEPIARDVMGAGGRVDFYAWPTLFRVKLLQGADGGWTVRTDSGINWPHPWGEATFLELSEGLSAEP